MAGRKSEVGVEDVRALVVRLVAAGQPVRVTSVMSALGVGHAVAKRLLGKVEEEEGRQGARQAPEEGQAGQEVAAAPDVPEALVGLFRGLTQGWRVLAVQERERADREAAAAIQAAEAVAARAREEAAQLSALLGEAERLVGERERELADARRQVRRLESEVRRLLAGASTPAPAAAAPVEPVPVAPVTAAAEPAAPPVAEAPAPAAPERAPGAKRAPKRDFSPEEDNRVREMRAAGAGTAEIGRALGRDRSVIANRLKHLGLGAGGAQA